MSAQGRVHRRSSRDSGQVMVIFIVMLVVLIGATAFAIDIGRVVYAQRELQNSTDAAALAGAQDLPNNTATTTARTYSGLSGSLNSRNDLPGVSMVSGYPRLNCLTSTGIPCKAPANANAVVVKQTVAVPMYFARVLGFTSMRLTATSTASAKGGIPQPLNVVLVLDTTASMNNPCSATVTGVAHPTRLDCAKAGVRALLTALWPCERSMTSCGPVTGGNVSNPIDMVGLMVFPGLTSTSYVSHEFDCASNLSSSNMAAYGSSPVYSIMPLSSDYRTSDTGPLNGANSNLVRAVDWGDGNSCGSSSYGAESPGGRGTYYAEALQGAQATLGANSRAGAQNVIVFLSDGDANASGSDISSGLRNNQCHQAITAAQSATGASTWVYSIAYGASTSSTGSCSTDSPRISAYSTMQQIASDPSKFFNQPTAGDLTTIFNTVATDITTTRLLPDDTP